MMAGSVNGESLSSSVTLDRGPLMLLSIYLAYLVNDSRSEKSLVHVEQAEGGVAHLAVVQAGPQHLVAL